MPNPTRGEPPRAARRTARPAWPFSYRPQGRGGRPPSGASSRGEDDEWAGLTAPDTFDCEAMGARADTKTNPTATVVPAAGRPGGSGNHAPLLPLDQPFEVQVDPCELRVLVRDAGETVGYELRFRSGRGKDGGVGWSELSFDPRDGQVVQTSVRTGEVMALAREAGLEEQPARMTEWVAGWFERADCHQARRLAQRLRAEAAAGRRGERIAVRRVQAAIVERLARGEELVVMAERGGFVYRDGRPDTSWLTRRAALVPTLCSKTGKLRRARTASYQVFCQLVAAVDRSPHEFGV
jgi:hypothetical protein